MNPLKPLALALLAALAFTLPARCASPEADIKQVVETFYQQYYRDFVKHRPADHFDAKVIKWVDASPATSPRFKKGLAKAIHDARKDNPELGLDGDPILAGNDEPEKGYRVKSVKVSGQKAAVALEGIGADAKEFHISLDVVNIDGHWLIDRIADIPGK